ISLPIFASSTSRAHFEQALVVALVLVPLWVVLAARLREGRWLDLPDKERNSGWTPPVVEHLTPEVAGREPSRDTVLNPAVARGLPFAAVVGLLLWFLFSHF